MPRRLTTPIRALGAATLALAVGGAPVATSVGAQPVQAISAADKQEGAKAHPQLLQEFGGAITSPQASYVESVGKTIAVQSGLGNARSDFTVTLLNSPVNNAFAIPGGYVYVTRQLVTLMNNEAELAGVLGHEVGHVAARHAAKRESASTRNAILGVLGTVLSGAIFGNSAIGQLGQKIFSTGSQLLTLKYSRTQESEADTLGITYLRRAGYDPRAMSSVLQSLANQNALDARLKGSTDQTPEWASTHPDPASRVRTAMAQASTNARGITNRDTFLTRVDGLMVGDDPKQGVVDGRSFVHPGFRMAFSAPAGYYLVNGTKSVAVSGGAGKGELSSAAFDGNLDNYVRIVFAGLAEQRIEPDSIRTTTVNGIPAAWGSKRVTSNGSPVDVVVFAYAWGPQQAFHFTTISQPGQAGQFDAMFQSMRRISATEAGAVRPRRLSVVTVRSGDTLQSLSSRMAYTDSKLDRFLVLNGLSATSRPVPGQKVKLVVY
ncbi:M48 family metalloprotease [Novosphingobium sp. KCTC 2891]|uniref:M48 family metalloprotease n=1 Tax=Novosphingobium sp. KCTC 2891 TaxID=2989730 RepID=UPI0022221BE7|nr:M48 family metalloprotease [Novosphingobium sp. KCTC 2891]MCW1383481.1 M48 family metalloprotease [Novosphingobium sp. KCTC 2891]